MTLTWIEIIFVSVLTIQTVGEMKYYSRVSLQDEYLPIVVSIMGAPGTCTVYICIFDLPSQFNNSCVGTDMALINTAIKVLEGAGRPTRVKTGSRMFGDAHQLLGWQKQETQ
jgi:hypothetical protein